MRRLINIATLLLFLQAGFGVQQDRAEQEHGGLRPTLPLEVQTKVSSENVQPGREVRFKTLMGTLVTGKVIPESAEVLGRVVGAQPRNQGQPAMLCIRLELARWDEGEMPLDGYITNEMVTRLVSSDVFGRKYPVRQFLREMPDLKLLKTAEGKTTLMRNEKEIVLKKGMRVVGEIIQRDMDQAGR